MVGGSKPCREHYLYVYFIDVVDEWWVAIRSSRCLDFGYLYYLRQKSLLKETGGFTLLSLLSGANKKRFPATKPAVTMTAVTTSRTSATFDCMGWACDWIGLASNHLSPFQRTFSRRSSWQSSSLLQLDCLLLCSVSDSCSASLTFWCPCLGDHDSALTEC